MESEKKAPSPRRQQLSVGVLGPKGTFSDAAADSFFSKQSVPFKKVFFKSLPEVFNAIEEGEIVRAIAPIENALGGSVSVTLDRLYSSKLKIIGEVLVDVSFCLARIKRQNPAGGGEEFKPKKIFGHPQAFEQCRNFLKEKHPNALLVASPSNSQALKELAESKSHDAAALGPEKKALELGLEIVQRKVEDSQYNVTRFLVIAPTGDDACCKPTGFDRTTLVLFPFKNRHGVLHEILGIFASKEINLSKIESRPSRNKLGEYIFHVDVEGHEDQAIIKTALAELKNSCKVKVLGSYPRAY